MCVCVCVPCLSCFLLFSNADNAPPALAAACCDTQTTTTGSGWTSRVRRWACRPAASLKWLRLTPAFLSLHGGDNQPGLQGGGGAGACAECRVCRCSPHTSHAHVPLAVCRLQLHPDKNHAPGSADAFKALVRSACLTHVRSVCVRCPSDALCLCCSDFDLKPRV